MTPLKRSKAHLFYQKKRKKIWKYECDQKGRLSALLQQKKEKKKQKKKRMIAIYSATFLSHLISYFKRYGYYSTMLCSNKIFKCLLIIHMYYYLFVYIKLISNYLVLIKNTLYISSI